MFGLGLKVNAFRRTGLSIANTFPSAICKYNQGNSLDPIDIGGKNQTLQPAASVNMAVYYFRTYRALRRDNLG